MKAEDKKTLLLVEDEVLISLSKQKELEKYGYNVLTTNTGEKAVVIFKGNDEIDLILMDIDLGSGIDGTVAAEIILREQEIPVVFLSSHTESEVVEKTEKITSYGYVVKSSSITVLDASIKMAFKLFEAYEKVHENESKQYAMISNISDVITIIDKTGIIRFKSHNIEKHFGWKPEDLEGSEYWSTVHPGDLERVQLIFSKLLEKDETSLTEEFRYKCKDGSYKPVKLTAINLLYDPNINGVLANYHDITERKQAEKAIHSYQQRLALHIEQSPLAVIDWDLGFHVAFWNRAAEKMFGFSSNEALGRHAAGLVVSESVKNQVNEVWTNLLNKKGGTRSTNENITKDGKTILCEWYNTAIVDEEGYVIGVSSLVMDITDRKRADEALSEANTIINRSPAVAFLWKNNEDWSVDFVSENVEKLTGYSAQAFLNEEIIYREIIHSDDLERVAEEVVMYSNKEGLQSFKHEPYRIITKNEDTKWIDDITYIRRDSQGIITHYEGIVYDITDRKQAEEEVKRQLKEKEILLKEVHREM